jgi:UDP-2-acetamido-3-amino-2,3-dideoxy-glucuronate N-acetyltransferase
VTHQVRTTRATLTLESNAALVGAAQRRGFAFAGQSRHDARVTHTIKPTAQVHESAELGAGTTVWELAQIREGARLGEGCVVGRGAYVGSGVQIGNNVKLQNYALVYEPAELGDGVFVGPAVVLTNDHNPRSVDPDGHLLRGGDWHAVGVQVAEGASLGARCVCVAPVRIGRWSMVAAGAVVTRDVADFALVVGVPARRIGWVGRSGVRLVERDGVLGEWVCPQTGAVYRESVDGDGQPVLAEAAPGA